MAPFRIGMEVFCGAHHLVSRLAARETVRPMPAEYVRP
jgi:hypothetical protein